MKIFDSNNTSWDSKVNFIDEENAFVGYDDYRCCCEHADWFLSKNEWTDIPEKKEEYSEEYLAGYLFDRGYFKEVHDGEAFDAGGMVIFRLTKNSEELFLHLFNCQNGYYGHGFEFKIGEETIKEGCL